MTRQVHLLVADGRPVLTEGVRLRTEQTRDILLVGHAQSADEAEALSARLRPDVVLVHAGLPPSGGDALCAKLKSRHVLPRVIVLDDTVEARRLLPAVEAGADGYLTPDDGLDAILEAVRRVDRGEACVPPALLGDLLGALIGRRREERRHQARYQELTRRERQVLALLAEGSDHAEVASILVISPQTARTHIQRVLTKLDVHSRLEAAALAVEQGWVRPGARRMEEAS